MVRELPHKFLLSYEVIETVCSQEHNATDTCLVEHLEREREIQRERERKTETGRETEMEKDTERASETERQKPVKHIYICNILFIIHVCGC